MSHGASWVVSVAAVFGTAPSSGTFPGGSPFWDTSVGIDPLLDHDIARCDFRRVRVNSSARAAIREGLECAAPGEECLGLGRSWALRPWLFEGITVNSHLHGPAGATGKVSMLRRFGGHMTVVSDSVAQSAGRKTMRFDAYIDQAMRRPPNLSAALAAEAGNSWYLCNSNFWDDLLVTYDRPPMLRRGHRASDLPLSSPFGALSFGVGRTGSGLPFHFHGGQFVEVTQGRKRWFAAPFEFEKELRFSPTVSSLAWLHSWSDGQKEETRSPQDGSMATRLPSRVQVCTQQPGETLYLPPMWWHATINIGETVFFLDFV